MDLVVNEWLPEYFRPSASREQKLQLQTFLQRFMERGDRIIVREPSPFIGKIYRYANDYQSIESIVTPIRNFIKLVLEDSNRSFRVWDNEIEELPESVEERLTIGNYVSDKYLFEAATTIEAEKLIVTTDARLKAHFEDEPWCKLELLADFLATY
jgi:hypothetical protein